MLTYYTDLSPYEYCGPNPEIEMLNVGWLSKGRTFGKGNVPGRFIARLECIATYSVNQMRGFYFSDFVETSQIVKYEIGNENYLLGDAEICVFSSDKKVYCSPNLILFYISELGYCPPESFIEAVMMGPIPPEDDYFLRLDELGMDWRRTTRATELGGVRAPIKIEIDR